VPRPDSKQHPPAREHETRYVYDFSEGSREMRELLGGKGANVAEMIRVLGPELVPAGFTITTEACMAYLRDGQNPKGLEEQIDSGLGRLEARSGRRLGDPTDPLLVSVRSGGPVSMPGMMDTVLNLGLTDESVSGLAERTGRPRFAWDSYRRLCQMFGSVVRGVPGARFEELIAAGKRSRGVELDTELDAEALRELTEAFKGLIVSETGSPFPQDPQAQLGESIRAVFASWNTRRAIDYRRLNRIPDHLGTAANVQQMVFGNTGETSGSGVAFSRDEVTGEPEPSGDFLVNAQGEDVVAGIRNTRHLSDLASMMPEIHRELIEILATLEPHFGDMQDVEFTIEEGRLFILQTRSAKRPAQAAVRFACDAVEEGILTREEALATIDADRLESLLHPTFDPAAKYEVLARGVAASPGAAKGRIAFSAAEAIARGQAGEDVILVRPFTAAEDVAGFHAARGILTSEGGRASHAALVARGMARPCVAGASDLRVDVEGRRIEVDGRTIEGDEMLALDGSAGIVTLDDVPLIEPEVSEHFETVLGWADEIRTLGVRANAETPQDAARARSLGAEGIGLCRTEHMFAGQDRDSLVKEMFLSAERWRRLVASERRAAATAGDRPAEGERVAAEDEFRATLTELERMQRSDFEAIFTAMGSRPVTIRLLDPPLHEFLPVEHFERELAELEAEAGEERTEARERLELAGGLEEANPMLGTRGARLGILYPQIYEMQVAAIIGAAAAAQARGTIPEVEVMLPLIAYEGELRELRELIERTAERAGGEVGTEVRYSIGTMIELPRSCLIAERIAPQADFFSFGTNDLTQTAIGFSRDDVEGRFIDLYVELGILDRSPFEGLDVPGVGALVRLAVEGGRRANPELHLGICGEHGGDPESIAFFQEVGLDYVSCSPDRVPVARIAAAQAAIAGAGRSVVGDG
jgi:pyruvate,orthophosphate dikinase